MNLPELCIRRPVMTTLLMVSFIVGGWFGYAQLPVAALPRVDFPTISVSASLPGASPETMASSVATPLERQFATIPSVNSIISINGQGTTQITLQFDLDRNIDGAALDVQSAISTAARLLPDEMTTPPSFRKVNPADSPVLLLSLSSSTLPLSTLNEYAETLLSPSLSTLGGVAQVTIYGPQKYAVRIQIDPRALAATGIGVDQIQTAVAAANSNAPVGIIDGSRQSVTLQASGQLERAEAYRSLVVAYRNGNPVRLGEIATVTDGVENDKIATWMNGTRAIVLAIQRQPDANTVAVVDAVKALLPTFRNQLPAAIDVRAIIDRSQSIRESVHDVQFTLLLTICLVVMVIFLFLRNLRATLIPALALPVSIIGTFGGMYVMGYSIDNLSLLAITLSVGFVVDDAIVMLENIVRHVEGGMRPFEAALKGSREIAFTILSITISLVAVFIPVLFMGGIVGRLFNQFAVTISIAILISAFVSLTLTPMLCSRMLKHIDHSAPQGRLMRWSESVFDGMLSGYERALKWALLRRRFMLGVTALTLVLSVVLFQAIPKGFFPTEDTGMVLAITEGPQDTSFESLAREQRRVADIILADPAVDVVNSTVGVGGPNTATNAGRMFVGLKPLAVRKVSAQEVIRRLRPKLMALTGINVFLQPIQNINVGGRLSKGLYQYTLQGTQFPEVQRISPQVEAKLATLPQLQDVTSDLQVRSPQVVVEVDRDRAATMNVTAAAVRNTLYSAFGARQISTIYTPSNNYEVILEVDPRFRGDVAALGSLYVPTTTGTTVPLEAVATIRRQAGPLNVNHQSALPAVTLSFNLAPGIALGQAVAAIQGAERELNLPATITTSFRGTAQVFQDSLKGQALLLLAAVFVIYIVLGILYESFIHPLTILSGLPSAGIGALLTLMLVRMDLSVIAIIGAVMLIGIVKKNAIMMIDFAIERRSQGDVTAEDAIYEACVLRFRPIMMTTMAAIMGAVPIALGIGAGAELRQPLGVVVVGGLVVSQLLTLFITPVIYLYLDALQTRWGHGRESLDPSATPHPAE